MLMRSHAPAVHGVPRGDVVFVAFSLRVILGLGVAACSPQLYDCKRVNKHGFDS